MIILIKILKLDISRLIGFAGTMDSGGPMSLFWGFVRVQSFCVFSRFITKHPALTIRLLLLHFFIVLHWLWQSYSLVSILFLFNLNFLNMLLLLIAFPVCGGVYSWSYLLAGPKWGPRMCLSFKFLPVTQP